MAFERIKNLSRGKKIAMGLIVLLVIILLLLALFLLFRGSVSGPNVVVPPAPSEEETSTPVTRRIDAQVVADITGANGDVPEVQEAISVSAELRATAFVERFGSYSNQGGFGNFDGLDLFMTDNFAKWVEGYRENIEKSHSDFNVYYGMDTKVISTEIVSSDEQAGTTQILLKTQRQEFNNTITNPRVFFQDIRLDMTLVGNDWKVDGAFWIE